MEHSTSLTNVYFIGNINRLFYAVVLKSNNSPALPKSLQYSFSLPWFRKKKNHKNEQLAKGKFFLQFH